LDTAPLTPLAIRFSGFFSLKSTFRICLAFTEITSYSKLTGIILRQKRCEIKAQICQEMSFYFVHFATGDKIREKPRLFPDFSMVVIPVQEIL
jgi:hypothetical protein